MSGNTKTITGSFPFFLKVKVLETVSEPRRAPHKEGPLHLSGDICSHEQHMVGSARHSAANSDQT